MSEERRLGKITSTMLGYEDHGIFTASVTFDYGGSSQGIPGYFLDGLGASVFIQGVLRACGVDEWERLVGRTVYVVIREGLIRGLEPLPTERGTPIDFEAAMAALDGVPS